jgi:hypothetical protein
MTRHLQLAATEKDVTSRIITIRGQRVILDADLAELYGVETKILNRAVGRNRGRFPDDFAFRLTREEFSRLRCQYGTSNQGRGGRRYPPYAFTEHGAIMAATVLRSRRAEEMSVFVVRAFVKMREQLTATHELVRRLSQIEKELVLHGTALADLYEKIQPLLKLPEDRSKKRVGFKPEEKRSLRRTGRTHGEKGKR